MMCQSCLSRHVLYIIVEKPSSTFTLCSSLPTSCSFVSWSSVSSDDSQISEKYLLFLEGRSSGIFGDEEACGYVVKLLRNGSVHGGVICSVLDSGPVISHSFTRCLVHRPRAGGGLQNVCGGGGEGPGF